MKLAYSMSRFPKLTETFVLLEILELERMGHEVDNYPLLRENEQTIHPEAAALVRRAHFTPFISLPILRSMLRVLRKSPRLLVSTVFNALWGTAPNPNFFFGALGVLPKVIHWSCRMEDQGIEHLHVHFANHPALAGYVISKLTGIPFSFTAHGSDLHKDRTMLKRKVEAAAFVTTVSEYNRKVILESCGPELAHKVHLIRAGIDTSFFSPLERPEKEHRPPAIVCVARMEEVKGHRFLIKACESLSREGIPFTCRLIGTGPLHQKLRDQASKAGLHQVEFLGPQSRESVLNHLRQSDIFVLPSVPTREGKREGLPVVLMEAMAVELAALSTRLSGIPELIASGENGMLVEPGNQTELTAALRQLVLNPELCSRLGKAAREKVQEEFSLSRTARSLAELFQQSLPPHQG